MGKSTRTTAGRVSIARVFQREDSNSDGTAGRSRNAALAVAIIEKLGRNVQTKEVKMKNTKQLKLFITVAALCLTAPGLTNLQAQVVPNAPTQPEIPRAADATLAPGQPTIAPGQPLRVNKCTQLVGTQVENPQGQTLGTVKDVVVDFNTGRVSYCVLGIDRGAFQTPKYLAVPLTAMRPSANGTELILNADREKLAEAQGFDRNNWPSVSNPAWGAQPSWQAAPPAPSSHELPRVQ